MTVWLTKPGKAATTLLVSSCQRAKASAASGRTRVWVMIVTPSPAADGHAAGVVGTAHGRLASSAKMRSGDSGRSAKRTPVAWATALETAGATGLIAHSPCALAPSGPMAS